MTTIGNIGIGLFIFLLLWTATLIIFVIGVKLQSNISWVVLVLATSVTIILLLFPINKNILDEEVDTVDKDYSIIYKNLLLAILLLSVLLGLSSIFILHCLEAVQPKLVKTFGVN